jgi:hypothetical protein
MMDKFDKDQFGTRQGATPESFEIVTHAIPTEGFIDIDLTQPNRLKSDTSQEATNVEGAKRIAEISTPTRDLSLFYWETPDYDYNPMLMVYNPKKPDLRPIIGMGEDFDVSDDNEESKCIITFTLDGRVLVFGQAENPKYEISTREIKHEQPWTFDDFPSDFPDDPES